MYEEIGVGIAIFAMLVVAFASGRKRQKKIEKEVYTITSPFDNSPFERVKEEKGRFTYHCDDCGAPMTKQEYIENSGQCDQCIWDDEDSDLILGGGW